jgi:hypothetical protein
MPSDIARTRAIVKNGNPTKRTANGWQLDNIRLAVYPDGHWTLASFKRTPDQPVLNANNKSEMLKFLDALMDEMEARTQSKRRERSDAEVS